LTEDRTAGSSDKEVDEFEFDCPECGVHIMGEVSKCPKCGVEFVIEEVTEVQCPSCGTTVPADATSCQNCGAQFEIEVITAPVASSPPIAPSVAPLPDEPVVQQDKMSNEALRHRFPELVAEVKPLLSLANDYGMNVSEGRRLIDKAVRAGKDNDVVSAVNYVKECKESIVTALNSRLDHDIEYLEKLANVAKSLNSSPAVLLDSIKLINERRAISDLEGALKESANGKKQAEKLTGKYIESNELCEGLEKLIQSSERFYVDVREARKLLSEAKEAGEHGDWSMMGILARKGNEEILKTMPDILHSELKKAKTMLLDAKAEGKDVTMLVKLLKEAGNAHRQKRYEEALERLIEFKAESKHL
jgi:predicted RNA-binding Zn-ribbon protein involved in translation (DUF1610 family)